MIDINTVAGFAGLGGAALLVGTCLCAARAITLRPPVVDESESSVPEPGIEEREVRGNDVADAQTDHGHVREAGVGARA